MNDLNTILRKGKTREFRCGTCDKFLSISPILYNDAVGNVCGRCVENGIEKKFDGKITFQTQEVYEHVAKHLQFPCSYVVNGCSEELKWDDIKNHENNCEFQKVLCPFSQEEYSRDENICEWQGVHKEIFKHVFEEHKNCVLSIPEVKISPTQQGVCLIKISTYKDIYVMIIFYYKEDIERYFCKVLLDLPYFQLKSYKYNICVYGEDNKKSIIIPSNSIEAFEGNIVSGEFSEDSLELDFRSLNKLLGSPSFLKFNFEIYNTNVSLKKVEIDVDEKIYRGLQCQCGNLLFPPIYVCQNGHGICNTCKNKCNYCSTCGNGILPGINRLLETITKLSKYSCKNKLKGCPFKSGYKQISFHEENCGFTDRYCVLQCGWQGPNDDMVLHIQNKHSAIYCNQIYKYGGSKQNYCVLFDGNIFLLRMNYVQSTSLTINLLCLGMMEGQIYEYELTLLNSCRNIKLTINHFSQPLLFENSKEIETPNITYPFDFLRHFITDFENFEFQINIKKIEE